MNPHKVVDKLHRKYCKSYNLNEYDVSVGLMAFEPVVFVRVKNYRTGQIVLDESYDYYGNQIRVSIGN